MSRTIVIGDLHGCIDEAHDLLKECGVTSDDRVIFAGDLVDRGPDSRACVELAMKHGCILGNHEEKHLFYRRNPKAEVKGHHLITQKQLSDYHYEYFTRLPLYIALPDYNAVVVHAGVLPWIPIEKQNLHTLLHCQNIKPPGTKSYWPSKAPEGFKFWANFWQGPERVIFGHSVLTKPLVTEWAVGIDTGAVFGRTLTAVILPEWKIVSVPARKEHFPSRADVANYHIMEDVYAYS